MAKWSATRRFSSSMCLLYAALRLAKACTGTTALHASSGRGAYDSQRTSFNSFRKKRQPAMLLLESIHTHLQGLSHTCNARSRGPYEGLPSLRPVQECWCGYPLADPTPVADGWICSSEPFLLATNVAHQSLPDARFVGADLIFESVQLLSVERHAIPHPGRQAIPHPVSLVSSTLSDLLSQAPDPVPGGAWAGSSCPPCARGRSCSRGDRARSRRPRRWGRARTSPSVSGSR